ncbi:ABC transporter ATP-binding protein [Pseudomonas syringae]|uniref:ABC transporter ATP-binding protein n=1 Tax=Pseudomonas ovata TaxID=1839709 RepID=UPI000D68B026|nr:ABC transporter ATP-binding protein [Pseudomonas ovata]MBD8493273.1 ABC transporter ATP-binding protein [Pseudomonas syringae]MBD8572752.1 ABC transporter ATP-binding protein [Pseudomonas syringae]MBD8790537.1 ABC transporter ATP-binding protein [Pseudomonas syringae]MBD8798775.1 ABC transporter ATP-binding protein [Pseudomonas syringae]MBD8809601.1 ABC transporter ATP-binding protein [Pseudomonas syringae]
MNAQLSIQNLEKTFGAVKATNNASFDIAPGELHAIIGPNGAGKSTLIAQIAGEITPDKGRILLKGEDITQVPAHKRPGLGLARAFQVSQLYPEFTLLENVALAIAAREGKTFGMWKPLGSDPELMQAAATYLQRVDLGARGHSPVNALSHGERRQLEIALALAQEASVLLLDEPMAGMGAEESARMTQLLQALKGRYSILLVEHDMDAVFALADRITVLVYGQTILTGSVEQIRNDPHVRAAYLGEEHA